MERNLQQLKVCVLSDRLYLEHMKVIHKISLVAVVCLLTFAVNAQSKRAALNHIALSVVNLRSSTDFYLNVVQLDTIPEPFHDNKHTWFTIGPRSHLHIIESAKEVLPHDKNSHLCFTVASVDDFASRLVKMKVPFSNWQGEAGQITKRVDGVKQIYFQDPDGYWVEINDAKD
jgi:lactoylglutathione lyase